MLMIIAQSMANLVDGIQICLVNNMMKINKTVYYKFIRDGFNTVSYIRWFQKILKIYDHDALTPMPVFKILTRNDF